MYSVWDAQLPSLVDAYLHWKHHSATAPEGSQEQVEHTFHVTHVAVFDLDPRFTVFQWGNELANVSLIRNGLLRCMPMSPELAFTFQALELYHQLQWHQSSFGIQAYTKVLCVLHGVTYQPHFRNQFSMTFDVYLTILHAIQSHIDQALGHGNPDWCIQHYCPACMLKQPGEPLLIPSSLKAMDGNNSAKQMDRADHADHHIFPSAYMISRADIDTFKDDVHMQLGQCGNAEHHDRGGCADTWQAASAVDEDTVKVFEQTGIFLSACRHGIILMCAEMLHSGELYMCECNIKFIVTDCVFIAPSIP
ncbi:hypothetical protein EDC04DRAFT_2568120 [Pisolithus marmoratus]|nr:hypothetical protein EDC04DRAFT_2568120 [Pisolithus marmoratus]